MPSSTPNLPDVLTANLFGQADSLVGYGAQAPHDGSEGTWVTKPDGSGYRFITGPGHMKRALALADELAGAYFEGYRAREREERR